MSVDTIVLQRRTAGPRADELLDALQRNVPEAERHQWDDSGHARLPAGQDLDRARRAIETQLTQVDDDWRTHVGIL